MFKRNFNMFLDLQGVLWSKKKLAVAFWSQKSGWMASFGVRIFQRILPNSYFRYIFTKLDGVGPVDNRPSPD